MDRERIRKAKIVCTLGPASRETETIRALAAAGMSVARLNASHGTRGDRAELVERVQAVDESTEHTVATMLDLQGPEIRTGEVSGTPVLEQGETVRLVHGEEATEEEIGLSVPLEGVAAGDIVLIDDGRIQLTVTEVIEDHVLARIDSGGELDDYRGVNVPGVDLDLDALTDADRGDIAFAAEFDVDFVAASFVRNREDVLEIREAIEDQGAEIPVIAKIERADAVDNLEGIVDAAYGVMVARGDLGVECPMEEVPLMQKRIIRVAREAGVPVITATEMLDSMIHERRPTRAEASDVANAVLDGTDAVMLSGETAIGDHPIRVVEAMDRIVRQAEGGEEYAELRDQRIPPADSRTGAIARSARYLARDVGARAVVVVTESGYTGLETAKFRPEVPIVAVTADDDVRRRLAVSAGVLPTVETFEDGTIDAILETAVESAMDIGAARSGDTVVALSGMMTNLEGARTTNMLKVHVAAETLATGRSVVGGRVTGPVVRAPNGDLTDVPEGGILVLDDGFDSEFTGDPERLAGIVDAREGMTGYPAIVARELEIPMMTGASLADVVASGMDVTLDAERGVVYAGDVEQVPESWET